MWIWYIIYPPLKGWWWSVFWCRHATAFKSAFSGTNSSGGIHPACRVDMWTSVIRSWNSDYSFYHQHSFYCRHATACNEGWQIGLHFLACCCCLRVSVSPRDEHRVRPTSRFLSLFFLFSSFPYSRILSLKKSDPLAGYIDWFPLSPFYQFYLNYSLVFVFCFLNYYYNFSLNLYLVALAPGSTQRLRPNVQLSRPSCSSMPSLNLLPLPFTFPLLA